MLASGEALGCLATSGHAAASRTARAGRRGLVAPCPSWGQDNKATASGQPSAAVSRGPPLPRRQLGAGCVTARATPTRVDRRDLVSRETNRRPGAASSSWAAPREKHPTCVAWSACCDDKSHRNQNPHRTWCVLEEPGTKTLRAPAEGLKSTPSAEPAALGGRSKSHLFSLSGIPGFLCFVFFRFHPKACSWDDDWGGTG